MFLIENTDTNNHFENNTQQSDYAVIIIIAFLAKKPL